MPLDENHLKIIILDNTGYCNGNQNATYETLNLQMTTNLSYSPSNLFFYMNLVLMGICAILVVAIVITLLQYQKNKKKLNEFVIYH